jgi:tRNA(Ile)-lysidine synthase
MLKKFIEFNKTHSLFKPGDTILLAASGGKDSMVLLDLFRKAGCEISLAHVNFRLRGRESDGDEDFMRDFARSAGLPIYTRHFDTKKYAETRNLSVQMAARDLRYTWFEELAEKHNFQRIATAHHQDDILETFLINLIRGTGIAGLAGIPVKRGNIIRPLLYAKREDIDRYARKHNIPFREDSSNDELKYLRNKLRHQVLPNLRETLTSSEQGIYRSIEILGSQASLLKELVVELENRFIKKENSCFVLSKQELLRFGEPSALLREMLKKYGFHRETTDKVISALNDLPGKVFYSGSHKLYLERASLRICPIAESPEKPEKEYVYIQQEVPSIKEPLPIRFEEGDPDSISIIHDKSIALLDAERISYPLLLRKWKRGDVFRPFGMKGKKKLSDFFIDEKIELAEKENTWLLCSGKDIVWVVGHRIDDRYKITPITKRYLKITLDR